MDKNYQAVFNSDQIVSAAMKKKVQKAVDDFEKVVESHLLYTLDTNNWGGYIRDSVMTSYVEIVSEKTNNVAGKPRVEAMAQMEYLLEVVRLNVSPSYRNNYINKHI